VVLDAPQLADNIGAVARVMANFGLERLRLVRPRDGWPQDRAWAAASGADWVLDGVEVFGSVSEAISDLGRVHAATARPRETVLPVFTPSASSRVLVDESARGEKVGILFGAERAGLETHDIALCKAIVTIPIDARHRSLNLAQAVAINAYEWKKTLEDAPPAPFTSKRALADGAMMAGLFDQLETELEEAGFFHPPEKKGAMVRNLRVALSKANFTEQEARTFRGVITALSRGRGRTLHKMAAGLKGDDDAKD
jgi:tRNA/rRNA methyltransferase